MRHTLVRFCSELDGAMSWWIPEADAETYRITKMNNNILHGVASPEVIVDAEKQTSLNKSIRSNAERYWLTPRGLLAPGGANVVVIDDPQMPALIPLIKMAGPKARLRTGPIPKSART
ncbi:hypothetical protein HOY82DRAFT_540159 [Tuber indicum]|nr:hypothetical protein HOY82DRAFT_540159 [Tuber indicum]